MMEIVKIINFMEMIVKQSVIKIGRIVKIVIEMVNVLIVLIIAFGVLIAQYHVLIVKKDVMLKMEHV